MHRWSQHMMTEKVIGHVSEGMTAK